MEDEVLHLRIGQVEHHLRTAAAGRQLTALAAQHPVGMLLEELALGVGHLGLNPDAELDTVYCSLFDQSVDAVGQFLLVYRPVAKPLMIIVARVFVAEPAVVHDEELAADVGPVLHHFFHLVLGDVHIHALPRVEEDVARRLTVVELILPGPAVERTAHAALTLIGVGHAQFGRGEGLTAFEQVRCLLLVDASDEAQRRIFRVYLQLVVTGPSQRGAEHLTAGLAQGTVL